MHSTQAYFYCVFITSLLSLVLFISIDNFSALSSVQLILITLHLFANYEHLLKGFCSAFQVYIYVVRLVLTTLLSNATSVYS